MQPEALTDLPQSPLPFGVALFAEFDANLVDLELVPVVKHEFHFPVLAHGPQLQLHSRCGPAAGRHL